MPNKETPESSKIRANSSTPDAERPETMQEKDSSSDDDVSKVSERLPTDQDVEGARTSQERYNNIFGNGTTYRTLGMRDTILVLATTEVGPGILTLPAILKTLGLVPGIVAIIGLGVVKWYTSFELLQFYRAHPHVLNVVEMGRVVGGRPLELVFGAALLFKALMAGGSASVTLAIALNTLSGHAACTVAFAAVGAVCGWALCVPRTFKAVAHAGLPCTISVLVAVFLVIISLGVAGHPRGEAHDFKKEIVLFGKPSFLGGVNACLRLCYAYAGNLGYVSCMAEMKNPSRDFPRALTIFQVGSVLVYLVTAVAIYALSGQAVRSPALGSAPEIPAKVAYAIVVPAILCNGMVFGHTGIKYMYVVVLRATKTVHCATENSVRSWSLWIGCASLFWVAAFVLANSIPIFDSIVSISSATFVAWFTFGVSGVFWYHRNWQDKFSRRNLALAVINGLVILQTLFMNSVGMWASVKGLLDVFNQSGMLQGSFSCADNSIF